MSNLQIILNVILGFLSLVSIIYGFLLEEYRLLFWALGIPGIIVIVIGYYVVDNRNKIIEFETKFKKIKETLNIYDRLNKLELKHEKSSN